MNRHRSGEMSRPLARALGPASLTGHLPYGWASVHAPAGVV